MKIFKNKSFFIKSFFLHIFLSIIVIGLSWSLLEPNAYNFMIKNFIANKPGDPNIAVIVIDDKSIEYHRWPWPREYYAKILEYLNTYTKTKIIGYDAILTTLDKDNPDSDKYFFNTISKVPNLVVGFSPQQYAYENETDKEYDKVFKNKFGTNIKLTFSPYDYGRYRSISKFPKPYFDAVKMTGSVNVSQNHNGYLTYMDQIVSVNGVYYPSLGLRMYLALNNTKDVTVYPDRIVVDKTGLNIQAVPNSKGIQTLINYYKLSDNAYSHKKYSAIDVIKSLELIKQGKKPIIDPSEFNGKIVFVGANAKAAALALEDAIPTPMQQKHPGVDIQATNLDNLVNNEFLKQTGFFFDLAILITISLITFILISKFTYFVSLGLIIVVAGLYTVFSFLCYRNGIAVNIITPLAIQLLTTIFGYSYRFLQEGKNKEKIKQAMGKYLSQDIMKNVVQNIDDIKLGGKRANVTVLFADIRGFTSMSEKMTAEEVSVILNEYFTEIEPIITKYNGVINKFIGDAVMAIFGEPIQDINHPQNAVKCAYEMLKTVDRLQDKWLFEGKPKIEIGIGINTGEAFVGNIGSEKRLEYTVIGDTVNLASRIESYNKVYRTNFLISSSTYSYVSSMADVIKISEVQIRGKAKKMDIYEVLRLSQND